MENQKVNPVRITVCIVLCLVITAGFVIRLIKWQIIDGEKYRELSDIAASYTLTTEAVRGEILDVNGEALACNESCFNIVIDKLFLEKGAENNVIELLLELCDKYQIDWEDTLPIGVNAKDNFFFLENKEDEIEYLKGKNMLNMNSYSSADECMAQLASRYELDYGIYTETMRRNMISIRYNMEINGYSMTVPYVFAKDISNEAVALISEATQGISGIDIRSYYKRVYKNGEIAPHIVGTTGSLSAEEYEELKDEGYSYNDNIGKSGIESGMEQYLKGSAGTMLLSRSASGEVTQTAKGEKSNPGNTVYLTLDLELQRTALDSLEKNIQAAREYGKSLGEKNKGEDCYSGAAVVLNVKDFSVLAAATYPSFDLSKYSDYNYYNSLVNNKNTPLFNRAFNGIYAPGSIFKCCVAGAALEENIITPTTTVNCTHIYDYYESDPVACMGTHGYVGMFEAMAQSCNYYFADVGRLLGIEAMYLYAERFGLGVKTGVEMYESTGILAGRDNDVWFNANTVKAAIGQSDNAFTPLQLATYVATIANNGVRYRTHLVSKVTSYDKETVIYENDTDNPEIVDETGISTTNISYVQQSMRQVASSSIGTAYPVFGDYDIAIAAKTGTAENSGSDHVTFICYAPYDDPEIAISVVLEHGAKGTFSMQVARDILDAYFDLSEESDSDNTDTSLDLEEPSQNSSLP